MVGAQPVGTVLSMRGALSMSPQSPVLESLSSISKEAFDSHAANGPFATPASLRACNKASLRQSPHASCGGREMDRKHHNCVECRIIGGAADESQLAETGGTCIDHVGRGLGGVEHVQNQHAATRGCGRLKAQIKGGCRKWRAFLGIVSIEGWKN